MRLLRFVRRQEAQRRKFGNEIVCYNPTPRSYHDFAAFFLCGIFWPPAKRNGRKKNAAARRIAPIYRIICARALFSRRSQNSACICILNESAARECPPAAGFPPEKCERSYPHWNFNELPFMYQLSPK